jgi:hypothetical protein
MGISTQPPRAADWQAIANAAIARAASDLGAMSPAQKQARASDPAIAGIDTLARLKARLKIADPISLFPDDGNRKYSLCTVAAVAHCVTVFKGLIGQRAVPSQSDVVKIYLDLTGGHNITLLVTDVLDHWQTAAMVGDQLHAYAQIDHRNHAHVQQAIEVFGGLYLRFYTQPDTEQRTLAGAPWEAGPITAAAHAVVAVACDPAGLTLLSWGKAQRGDWLWWDTSVAEAYVLLPPEAADPTFDPGVDAAKRQATFAALQVVPLARPAPSKLAAD